MECPSKASLALTGLAVAFLALAMAFHLEIWGRYEPPPALPRVDPSFTNTSTVRTSLAELKRTGGDTSEFACNACHEVGDHARKLRLDEKGSVILPDAHSELVMRHGRSNRNDNCFNCHDEANREMLRTRDGRMLKLEESTMLCASCHGPTYRDWESGIHGRTSGFWKRDLGPIVRKDCADCHDPHAPAFPSVKTAPGPHGLHQKQEKGKFHG